VNAPVSPRATLTAIVLTFNAAAAIERTLRAAQRVADRVVVVDSGSTDATLAIVRRLGIEPVHRRFVHYADQRNWAIDRFGHGEQAAWQLHLDADEVLDDQALVAIDSVLRTPGADAFAWVFERRTWFDGRALRFGGATNYQLRLFASGRARCEDRLYDQHFVSPLPTRRIAGLMHDLNCGTLAEWTARHNRWSDLESAELQRERDAGPLQQIEARLSADVRERRRLYKRTYYAAPPVWRALALFGWRYAVLGGFLDGRAGFLYAVFQALWFRLLVDAKLIEAQRESAAQEEAAPLGTPLPGPLPPTP
jgi:glycosyltransferase involved in cell wall biosynthesis